MKYEDILKAKDECYKAINDCGNPELLNIFKYYKGDLLPLINSKCRKDMTCGDIDAFQWDFKLKRLRFIECKRTIENNKESQTTLLEFLSMVVVPEYKFEVFKIIGDPPFNTATIIQFPTKAEIKVDHEELIKFLNFESEFSDQGLITNAH